MREGGSTGRVENRSHASTRHVIGGVSQTEIERAQKRSCVELSCPSRPDIVLPYERKVTCHCCLSVWSPEDQHPSSMQTAIHPTRLQRTWLLPWPSPSVWVALEVSQLKVSGVAASSAPAALMLTVSRAWPHSTQRVLHLHPPLVHDLGSWVPRWRRGLGKQW